MMNPKTFELDLAARFSDAVSQDERAGYEGYIVKAENLVEFATALRDDFGYDFLSSVTGVDYLPDDIMEVVYHIYQSTGGHALVFKVQTPRDRLRAPMR
jgi:NADH:ubiquinone oxidoreductase subunit C